MAVETAYAEKRYSKRSASAGKNSILVSCPVCNKNEYNTLFHDRCRREDIDCFGTYVQCNECSLVYLQERLPWEEIVKYYSMSNSDITANAGLVDLEILRREVRENVPKWKLMLRKVRFRPHVWPLEHVQPDSKRLLDFGCGSGAKLWEFAKRGYDVWGVDVGSDAIRCCRKLLPQGHFIQGELQKTNLPEAYYDFIRTDNVFEHVPNLRETMRECYRLLKKGGRLLIYVPHGRSLSMRLMKGNSISSWIPFHLQLFTRKSLSRLMKEAGFADVNIYSYNPVSWLPLSFMQWWCRKKPALKCESPVWLCLACYPVGWLAARLGLAEELVGTCVKR